MALLLFFSAELFLLPTALATDPSFRSTSQCHSSLLVLRAGLILFLFSRPVESTGISSTSDTSSEKSEDTNHHRGIFRGTIDASLFSFPFCNLGILKWQQLGGDLDGINDNDLSGSAVALSDDGNRVAIAAADFSGNDRPQAGHVRMLDWDGSTWNLVGEDIDGEASGDRFGFSLDLSADGSVVAVGSPTNDGSGSNAGHVQVHSFDETDWTPVGTDINGAAAGDFFGWSVALSEDGNRVAIGAPRNDNANGNSAGHVRVFDWNAVTWSLVNTVLLGEAEADEFGFSVALSSDGLILAVGARANDGGATNAGHVRVFDDTGVAWVQRGNDIDGAMAFSESGYSVALSSEGDRVAVGAHLASHFLGRGAGQVKVYDWDGSSWTQVGQDINGENPNDLSGTAIALSADGNRLAVGAEQNKKLFPRGIPLGRNAGHVRVYDWNGNRWRKVGRDINGEDNRDFSGSAVALSADGSRLAVGGTRNDGDWEGIFHSSCENCGHVRVYEE